MPKYSIRFHHLLVAAALTLLCHGSLAADETEAEASESTVVTPLDENGRIVQFERDIAPILRDRCLKCHGPDDAKNDFRVDDIDSLMGYVEPEDWESSSLYTDYLLSDDEDILMPPHTHGGPLTASELALIRVWIEEGAVWPDGFELVADSEDGAASAAVEKPAPPRTLGQRIWTFQGYLHPATIHFPIAFFLLGGVFVVLGWKWPSVGTQIPLACLLLGSIAAIASSLMGWSFAPVQGYGNGWNPLDWSREVDVHRWSGLIVTIASVIFAVIALISLWKDSEALTKYWKIGLLLLAGMVGAVGHQGGEMSYGEHFYPEAFDILLGTDGQDAPVATAIETDETNSDPGSLVIANTQTTAADDSSEAE